MTNVKSCSIKLLNKTYDIKCPEHEAFNLQQAAEKLNNQLLQNKRKFKQLDEQQNLVLAALHISHELICCQQLQARQRYQVTQFISSLETKINQVVNGDNQLDLQTE